MQYIGYTITSLVQKIKKIKSHIRNDSFQVRHILTDSRSLINAESTLFFAIKTNTGNGHRYIGGLIGKGVHNFVIQEDYDYWSFAYPECNWIFVGDTIQALQEVATYARGKALGKIVGITGSNGKTIVKDLIVSLLSGYHLVSSPHSYNSQIGVALSLWSLPLQQDGRIVRRNAIIEAGISKKGEMNRLEKMIRPEIGVFTSIGSAHQEGFESLMDKIDEKILLFQRCKHIIVGSNAHIVMERLKHYGWKDKIIYWSTNKNEPADYYVETKQSTSNQTEVTIISKDEEVSLCVPFVEYTYIIDSIHSLITIKTLFPKINLSTLDFSNLSTLQMRMEVKQGIRNNTLINDSYSLDLQSLTLALDFMRRRSIASQSQRVVILTDLLQSGLDGQVIASDLAHLMKQMGVNLLIIIGTRLQQYYHLFQGLEVYFFSDTMHLIHYGLLETISNSCILLKGARVFHLEEVARYLSYRNHPTSLEVSLRAIVHNVNIYRHLLPPSHRMIAMIKANAYGIGDFEVARSLQDMGISYLAVALADEGKSLRMRGIHCPIMVMNPEVDSFEFLFTERLEPEVYSFELLEMLQQAAKRRNIVDFPIHIKIDSGMHRLGFLPNDVDKLIERIQQSPNLCVKSIFSHLATADNPAEESFTQYQLDLFDRISHDIIEKLGYPIMRHILNTAGIGVYGKSIYAYDMVRLGIGIYGYDPLRRADLRPVARLRTTILQIKTIPSGQQVGYGHNAIMTKLTRVGIIPIGYADGFRRCLGNGLYSVEVNGQLCPTIGNICMDSAMIDLTSVDDAKEGDEVILFGSSLTPLSNIAEKMQTIPYEVLTSIGDRVRRTYILDDTLE